ncbi:uncharacterized protein LAESUDRAFT_423507 [Laetiporus sulphureus 93-53]|uniref:C3H1-type domain-containing protein n=1 Tax=Laetiporus sulphureus 93-53 TaxID=1314785 RepID=A0A165GID2_9APHY|nr:uncharacterized protein LAESUDRAFT_423507 [Laetiporus sulphureus 93-53]KZT10390.1 hypothetical protein LAESUDRAFT_423507 [Laetiporus sulphureus 93-53]
MSPVMTTQTTDRKMKARTRTAQAKRSPPAKSTDNEISNTPAGPSSSPVVASVATAQSKTTAESGITMAIPKFAMQTPDQTAGVAAPRTHQKRRKVPSVCRSCLDGHCKKGDECPRRQSLRESATTSQKRAQELDRSMQCTPIPDEGDELYKDEEILSSPLGAVDTTARTDSSQETDNRSEATSINKRVNRKTQIQQAKRSICWSHVHGRCKNGDQCPRKHSKRRERDAKKPLPSVGKDGIATSTSGGDEELLEMPVDRSKASVSGQPQVQANPSQSSHEDILEMIATAEKTAAQMHSASEPKNELRSLPSAAADNQPSRFSY